MKNIFVCNYKCNAKSNIKMERYIFIKCLKLNMMSYLTDFVDRIYLFSSADTPKAYNNAIGMKNASHLFNELFISPRNVLKKSYRDSSSIFKYLVSGKMHYVKRYRRITHLLFMTERTYSLSFYVKKALWHCNKYLIILGQKKCIMWCWDIE